MKSEIGNRKSKMPLLIVSAIAIAALAAALLWRAKWATYHFATVDQDVLYRDGNRGVREFSHAIERGKIKTIVALIDDSELANKEKPEFGDEVSWCQRNGVRIERIPIPLGGWPTSEDVKTFLAVVADKQNQPVLVHCAQGVRRTGMMVAAYQRSTMRWDAARCKAAMLAFGHSQRSMGDVEKFIDVYDPATGKVPEEMPVGKE